MMSYIGNLLYSRVTSWFLTSVFEYLFKINTSNSILIIKASYKINVGHSTPTDWIFT